MKRTNPQRTNPFKKVMKGNLFSAVRANNDLLVDEYLALGADPDQRDADGYTPLMYAIHHDLVNMVQLLLFYNAEVNNEGPHGWFPLLFAVDQGNHNILSDLLLVGELDVNKTLPSGHTALHLAVQKNDPVAAELLVIRGADVGAETINGTTPFMMLTAIAPDKNISAIKSVLQAAMAEAASPEPLAKQILYPKSMKHKVEGGRRTRRQKKMKRCRSRTRR
jgi:ankyrin repeat protein